MNNQRAQMKAIGGLLIAVANTATRIRLSSSYAPPNWPWNISPEEHRDDLLILSDALHILDDLGFALANPTHEAIDIEDACDRAISYLRGFIPDADGVYPAGSKFGIIKDFHASMNRCLHNGYFNPARFIDSLASLKAAFAVPPGFQQLDHRASTVPPNPPTCPS